MNPELRLFDNLPGLPPIGDLSLSPLPRCELSNYPTFVLLHAGRQASWLPPGWTASTEGEGDDCVLAAAAPSGVMLTAPLDSWVLLCARAHANPSPIGGLVGLAARRAADGQER